MQVLLFPNFNSMGTRYFYKLSYPGQLQHKGTCTFCPQGTGMSRGHIINAVLTTRVSLEQMHSNWTLKGFILMGGLGGCLGQWPAGKEANFLPTFRRVVSGLRFLLSLVHRSTGTCSSMPDVLSLSVKLWHLIWKQKFLFFYSLGVLSNGPSKVIFIHFLLDFHVFLFQEFNIKHVSDEKCSKIFNRQEI